MVSSGSVNSWEFRGCSNSAQGRDKKDNFVERVRRGLLGVDWVTPHHLCSPFLASPSLPSILLSLRSKRFHPLSTAIKIWPTRRGFEGSQIHRPKRFDELMEGWLASLIWKIRVYHFVKNFCETSF